MLLVYDVTTQTPDIEATAANLRGRFYQVEISWEPPVGLRQDLFRVQGNSALLEEAAITNPESVGVVRLNPEDAHQGSVQLLNAEIFVARPKTSTNVYELCGALSESLVFSTNRNRNRDRE